jgi:hypothetical protein
VTIEQLSLDDVPVGPNVRLTDPDTSLAAGAQARITAGTLRAWALSCLGQAGDVGLTDFELADWTGRQQTSIGKRRGELRDAGYVEDSGKRRPAPSGAPAIVWQLTPAGEARLLELLNRGDRSVA